MTGCVNVRDNICAYIDNELNEEEKLSFEEHIQNCSECSRELEEMKRIVGLCTSLPQKELPDDFSAELHERLLAVAERQKSNTVHRAKGFALTRRIASIAAGVLLIFLAVNFVKFGRTPSKTSDNIATTTDILMEAEASDAIREDVRAAGIADAVDDTADGNAAADEAQLYFSTTFNESNSVDVDRSADALDREITKAAMEKAETEKVYKKMSTVTITADEPEQMAETIRVLAEGNGGEEAADSELTEPDERIEMAFSSSVGRQVQLQFVFHQVSYERFLDVLNDALGASNVQMGAFVSEDVTETLNSMIVESEAIDIRFSELQKRNGEADSDEIDNLRMQKEKIDSQIEKMRLDSDLVSVTVYINQK